MQYFKAICRPFVFFPLAALWAALPLQRAAAVELDLKPFRAATCTELLGEYQATQEVNREALKEMRRSSEETGGSNGLGGVTHTSMSVEMVGIAENANPDSAIEELAAYQRALVIVMKEKKCTLPRRAPGR